MNWAITLKSVVLDILLDRGLDGRVSYNNCQPDNRPANEIIKDPNANNGNC